MAVLEGDWHPPRMTVLRYPSFEQAKAMYDSPAYVAARALRQGATGVFQHGAGRGRRDPRLNALPIRKQTTCGELNERHC